MQLILLLLILLMPGCKRTITVTHFHGHAHTHPYHIQIGQALSQKEKESIKALLSATFEDIDTFYNHWNPHSELSQVNQLELGETFTLSPSLLHLIEKAKELTTFTEGHFDPTLGSLISAWKSALLKGKLPDSPESIPTGWDLFSFENGEAKKFSPHAQIDLDGFLKGFTIDQITKKLLEKGYANIYVEWGGDIRSVGKHPSGRNWSISLPNFEKSSIPLTMALATSGNQTQSKEIEGKRYSHIVIPATKEACPSLETVSVQAPSALLADALATALMTFPSIEAVTSYLELHRESLNEYIVWIQNNQGETKKWVNDKH